MTYTLADAMGTSCLRCDEAVFSLKVDASGVSQDELRLGKFLGDP